MYAIASISVIPIRAQPSEKSEMISQLLFGETVEVLNASKKLKALNPGWSQIRCEWDGYIGWISTNQLTFLGEEKPIFDHIPTSFEVVQAAMSQDFMIPLTLGATLPNYDGIQFEIKDKKFTFSGQVIEPNQIQVNTDFIIKIARKYLYAPYLWGGRSPFGIDCSGFSQMCYKILGIKLPRDAYQQAEEGEIIDFIEQTQPGDLAFFVKNSTASHITHVGILLEDNLIIHASGRVRIDKLDHNGIFNEEVNNYSHLLRIVKRILPTDTERAKRSNNENIGKKIGETATENPNALQLFN
jgi:gamma-D-glutamyl-L-lysine dipeptidyl-peptidase